MPLKPLIAVLSVLALSTPLNAATIFDLGSDWKYLLGTQEASAPDATAWRQIAFDDSTWSAGATPLGYGEPIVVTTLPTSANASYTSVFARKTFSLDQPAGIVRLELSVHIDDGYVIWINGHEVGRFKADAGEPAFNASATSSGETAVQDLVLTENLDEYLVPGDNVMAVQILNSDLGSSDLVFNASLASFEDNQAPEVVLLDPPAGATVAALTRLEVYFSEPVTGVDAADLLINNRPADSVVSEQANQYVFQFTAPPTGVVLMAWSEASGIRDLAATPNDFAGGNWNYLLDPSANPERIVISEFMASNNNILQDEDNQSSDWIELNNAGSISVNLGGWYLTDDAEDLTKWRFPATSLAAGGYLIVFASGKDRAVTGGELHTNFQLSRNGEFLALVRPDGVTIEHAYAPMFPEQVENVSYGVALDVSSTQLVRENQTASWLVPSGAGDLPADWAATEYNANAWNVGTAPLGYDTVGGAGAGGGISVTSSNVALLKNAVQSSSAFGGTPDVAVNGNLGDFTHTAAGQNLPSTWEVDLADTYGIERVVLHNRSSCCGSRLRDITVRILDAAGTTILYQSALLNPENALGSYPNGPASLSLNLIELTGGLVYGAKVRVVRTPDPDLSGSGGQGNTDEADVLSMAEVEVFGVAQPPSYDSLVRTDLESAMAGINASALVRLPFQMNAEEVGPFDVLVLRVRYDDGFVAYLNGQEIARRNAPATLAWNSLATAEHPKAQAVVFEAMDVSLHAGLLRDGLNVLALHGLNAAPNDDDFLLSAELDGSTVLNETRRYFADATPGGANGDAFVGFVSDTKFDPDRGFYDIPISVSITNETEGAAIYYTLDGTAPTEENGQLYNGPIPVNRTTTLRAAAFKPGWRPSNADTHTYLFLGDVVRQSFQSTLDAGFPSTWGGTAPDYGMDPDVIGADGTDRYGGKYTATITNDLLSLPTMSIVMNTDDMFGSNGIYTRSTSGGQAWERPASAELIHPDGTKGFQVNCGIRIQGGAFRSHGLTKKHSLRLVFKSIYGPSKLEYPLLGEGSTEAFDTLTLRANSNDGWQWDAAGSRPLYVRDSFGRATRLAMGGVTSHETFVHLYINGVYWGLYNPVERPDHSFSETYFGGDKDNWDAINSGTANNGDLNAWNAMVNLANQGLSSTANYQRIQGNNPDGSRNPAYPKYLDVTNLIDYMIVNLYVGNTDWPHKNYWVGRDRTEASSGFKYYMWDSEWSMGIQSSLTTDQTGVSAGVAQIYAACKANAEFRVLFGDRLHRAFFNDGPLYVDPGNPLWNPVHPERNRPAERFEKLVERIDRAIVAESARWGDQHASTPYTRDEHWAVERDNLLNGYFPYRSGVVLNQFRNANLYPRVGAPDFNQAGGVVPLNFELILSHTNGTGTIYFTDDGTDPRLEGGALSGQAQVYSDPIQIDGNVHIRARALVNNEWSALMEATFHPGQTYEELIVSEIMYHPASSGLVDGDEFEFLELKNVGNQPLDLSGLSFTAGISFHFTNGTRLNPGAFFVLARGAAQFQTRYPGVTVHGVYAGNLENGGETLTLSHLYGGKLRTLTYGVNLPWPLAANGLGFSLVPTDPNGSGDPDDAGSWRASGAAGGSPGREDPSPNLPGVVLNEILSRPAAGGFDLIELHNPTGAAVDVGGWYLTDSARDPFKFRIPAGTVLAAGGFAVFNETQFNPEPGLDPSFSLSSLGEQVVLFSGDGEGRLTGYSHGFEFGAAAEGVTFGRHVISTGEARFPAQVAPTLPGPNAGPRLGPVVLSEIHYHPADNAMEFVELLNVSDAAIPLFEPGNPANTWRLRGFGFDFPAGFTLPPLERVLLVEGDPSVFRARYQVPAAVPVFGPVSGSLQNNGERLELQRAETTTNGLVYITVDEVRYNDKSPWPTPADGSGPSLQRLESEPTPLYGDDPIHWRAAAPSPGAAMGMGVAPAIVAQPQDKNVVAYQTATLTAEVSDAAPVHLQWRFNGQPILNATNATLVLPGIRPDQAGAYDLVAFNAAGSAVSDSAQLRVLLPANILSQPKSLVVREGSGASFSVEAVSSTLIQYQWRFNGMNIPNATNAVLSLLNVQEADDGLYTVVLTDGIGPVTSAPATLTVLLNPVVIVPPLSQNVVQGGSVTLSIVTRGSLPMSYRWRRGSFTLKNETLHSPVSFLTLNNLQLADGGSTARYSVVLTNAAFTSPGVLSASGTLTVLTDTDGDGVPDSVESAAGLNPNDPADGVLDADNDGQSNRSEYEAGTNPKDPADYFKVDQLAIENGVSLRFQAVSNKTYSVMFTESLRSEADPLVWFKLEDLGAHGTNRTVTIRDAGSSDQRYYRVVTPREP